MLACHLMSSVKSGSWSKSCCNMLPFISPDHTCPISFSFSIWSCLIAAAAAPAFAFICEPSLRPVRAAVRAELSSAWPSWLSAREKSSRIGEDGAHYVTSYAIIHLPPSAPVCGCPQLRWNKQIKCTCVIVCRCVLTGSGKNFVCCVEQGLNNLIASYT